MLLLYKNAGLALERQQKIAAHLALCDFCGAEMQLLGRHWKRPARAPRVKQIEMPANLRRLAEDLMAEPSLNRSRFVETIYEIERLTLTDA